ncbi:uncharacterized protein I206_105281 [Kwoniella pini CBS 10737]|uniref:Uncharacterized protein n=1 Tax=Kwoniella pini CBS 10737 TaxID=1296096 RepID=A0A1B9I4P6_9TREE|nr:uncharacterized protein I206_03810 [Kwoniella pini CBS 10737]OCF50486.1 hypothetical protein I206_03810 [Kwoniella pini CBS 10737]
MFKPFYYLLITLGSSYVVSADASDEPQTTSPTEQPNGLYIQSSKGYSAQNLVEDEIKWEVEGGEAALLNFHDNDGYGHPRQSFRVTTPESQYKCSAVIAKAAEDRYYFNLTDVPRCSSSSTCHGDDWLVICWEDVTTLLQG